jgi:hypothetical protein
MRYLDFLHGFFNENKPSLENEPLTWYVKVIQNQFLDECDEQLNPVIQLFIDRFFDVFVLPHLSAIVVDVNGHNDVSNSQSLKQIQEYICERNYNNHFLSIHSLKKQMTYSICSSLYSVAINEELSPKINKVVFGYDEHCDDCGIRLEFCFDLDELKISLSDNCLKAFPERCECENNDFIIKTSIPVPSKKLVFANDLRKLFKKEIDELGYVSVNYFPGEKKTTLFYAQHGLIFCFVGNSCPYVCKNKDDSIFITSNSSFKKDKVGIISTSLWWYCAMDHDDFLARCKKNRINPNKFEHIVVDINKDTADVIHFSGMINDPEHYSIINKK